MKKQLKKACIALLACCVVTGCGSALSACNKKQQPKPETPPTNQEQVEKSVTLDKSIATVACYESVTLVASSTGEVTWSSSDNTIATVSGGVVSALKEGEVTISATCGSDTATCKITVTPSLVFPVLHVNEKNVTLLDGGEFTLSVGATWAGSAYNEEVDYTWAISQGQKDDIASVTPSADGNSAIVRGLKPGSSEITVFAHVRGKLAVETVKVQVKEAKLILDVATGEHINFSTQEDASYVADLALVDTESSVTEVGLSLSAMFGMANVTNDVEISWSSQNSAIAKVEGGVIKALKVGETYVVGSVKYTDANSVVKSSTVKIKVIVDRISVDCPDNITLQTSSLSSFSLSQELIGNVEDVKLNGRSVYLSYAGGNISLDENKLPQKVADGMGDNIPAVLVTSKVNYNFSINLYTKIVNTKADLDSLKPLAINAANNKGSNGIPVTWDGYFVLGSDIEYDGEYDSLFGKGDMYVPGANINSVTDNRMVRGFTGVFDGKGHNINGMIITKNRSDAWGFIPILKDEGVIKNISFTNAQAIESSFLTSYLGGTVENVMIHFAKLVSEESTNEDVNYKYLHYASVAGAGKNGAYAVVRNCFFDASQAEIDGTVVMLCMGSMWSQPYTVENVFAITPQADDKVKAYKSFSEMMADEAIELALSSFDSYVWNTESGAPVFANLYDDTAIAILSEIPSVIDSGREIDIQFNKLFANVIITREDGSPCEVAYSNGKIVVPQNQDVEGDYILTAKYYYGTDEATARFSVKYVISADVSKTVDFNLGVDGTCGISEVVVDLSSVTADLGNALVITYDGIDISGVATLNGSTLTIPVSAFNNGKDYGEKTIFLKAKNSENEYNVNVELLLITKVINTKADLDNMGAIASAVTGDGATWDGYFALGGNIAYNGVYAGMFGDGEVMGWKNPATHGFKGVFDGRGYNIDGLIIEGTANENVAKGFIPTLMATGVIKNVSFTNACVKDSGYVTSACAEGATYRNIYVQLKSLVGDTDLTASFNPYGGVTLNVFGVFVDGSKLETYVNNIQGGSRWAGARLVDRKASDGGAFINPYCQGVGNELTPKVEGYNKLITEESTYIVSPNVESFKSDSDKQANIAKWDGEFWAIVDGMPLPVNLVEE